jgi:ubiquinone biosynthesis protein UbiJ
MMRILLATGEEAVYRTVEELAMGISSGTITAAARFFDLPTQGWRAIDSHPEYHEALARAASLASGSDFESQPAPKPGTSAPPMQPDAASGPLPIYQMFSLSAAELQARRRPAWLLPGLAGAAGLAMLISVIFAVWGTRGGNTSFAEPSPALSVMTRPASDAPLLPPPSSVEAMRLAPVNLNSHLAFAIDAAGRHLSDSVVAIGAQRLLSRGRQLTQDSVRLTGDLLATVRALVANYRGAQRQILAAYRDTAAILVKSGFWSKIDQQEWKVYPPSVESAEEGAEVDSILTNLERLYELLAEQPGGYREVEGHIQFDDPASGIQYERLRTMLSRYEGEQETALTRPNGALAMLRRALSQTAARSPRYSLP